MVGTKRVGWGAAVRKEVRDVNSERNCLDISQALAEIGQTHDFASLYALFSMSSAPGPMISELKEAVVFRICDTTISHYTGEALTIVQQECLSYWLSHIARSLIEIYDQSPQYVGCDISQSYTEQTVTVLTNKKMDHSTLFLCTPYWTGRFFLTHQPAPLALTAPEKPLDRLFVSR